MGNTFKVTKVETKEYEAFQFNLDNKEELEELLLDKGYDIKYKDSETDLYKDTEWVPEDFKLEGHCCVLQKGQVNMFLIDKDYLILNNGYIHDIVTEDEFNRKYIRN